MGRWGGGKGEQGILFILGGLSPPYRPLLLHPTSHLYWQRRTFDGPLMWPTERATASASDTPLAVALLLPFVGQDWVSYTPGRTGGRGSDGFSPPPIL